MTVANTAWESKGGKLEMASAVRYSVVCLLVQEKNMNEEMKEKKKKRRKKVQCVFLRLVVVRDE